MASCSVCRAVGHSRKGHYVKCKICAHQRFFYSMEELIANSEPDPVGSKSRVNVCGNVDRHEEIRKYASTLPEGLAPRPKTKEEREEERRLEALDA